MAIDKYSYLSNANAEFIDDLFQKYQNDPAQIDASWHKFFEGYELASQNGFGAAPEVTPVSSAALKEIAVSKLINAYRERGHLIARTNPVRERRQHTADLSLEYFGLSKDDLETKFEAGKDIAIGKSSLRVILNHLEKTYCSTIGVEFKYCRNEKLRQWLCNEMEPTANQPNYSTEKKRYILNNIYHAVQFENFLQTKHVGKKRFSLEGIEALIPSLDAAINQGAELGVREFVFGMAHRGRLNVLVNVFGKSFEQVFSEFDETLPAETGKWSGDVKYHLGRSANIKTEAGHDVHLSLVPNPSHLEAVNPVVQGIVYAKARSLHNGDIGKIMPILIHGDAAMAGQGINYEMSNMSGLTGYSTDGTVHIILNNQIGFTTNYKEARSSIYCSDLAKVTESPVFHVNADDPEAVVHAVEMAIKIRHLFKIDVYVDILGYRKYGHNEGDEPRFTQPVLYNTISKHENVYQVFLKQLLQQNVVDQAYAKKQEDKFKKLLQEKLDHSREEAIQPEYDRFSSYWEGFRESTSKDFDQSIDTSVSIQTLNKVAKVLSEEPESVSLFSKMKKLLKTRHDLYHTEKKVDWAMAELMAYGSLLVEGHGVRVSGQDAQRGTFSHRHAVIKDVETEEHYIPLNNIQKDQAELSIYNSQLSEYCVLGFEHGYALAQPNALVIWEAQFGDFANGAQIMIDQFISSSESKWQRASGVTLLLPHGYEGQGPEHSSARVERFLQLTAENNMYVCNITEPSNYFHMMRRQVNNEFRIPLVVFTPKSLLRHPKVQSPVSELTTGSFKELIDDVNIKPADAKTVLLCTGKVYYDLLEYSEENKVKDVAIVRLEQLYPLPKKQLNALKKRYKNAKDWIWVQEEPENMGAWSHILRLLPSFAFRYVGRKAAASPAVGNSRIHKKQQEALVKDAFKAKK